jgi:hypothetical protein
MHVFILFLMLLLQCIAWAQISSRSLGLASTFGETVYFLLQDFKILSVGSYVQFT